MMYGNSNIKKKYSFCIQLPVSRKLTKFCLSSLHHIEGTASLFWTVLYD